LIGFKRRSRKGDDPMRLLISNKKSHTSAHFFGPVEKVLPYWFAPKSPKGDLSIKRLLKKPPLGGRRQKMD
jgi:hypothetical protein